jgi:flagellar basal-body rod protein FlgG
MMGIVEIGSLLLSRSQAETEVAAQNLANMTTSGYRARRIFAQILSVDHADTQVNPAFTTTTDFSPGVAMSTGVPLDLAIEDDSFFRLRSGDEVLFTRAGRFSRDAEGYLIAPGGQRLQGVQGDILTRTADVRIDRDGLVYDEGKAVARLALARFADASALTPAGAGLFISSTTPADVAVPVLQPGMLEMANVSTGDEMVSLMAALRRAESGQKLIQTWDGMMDRVLTTFGQV